MKAIRNINRNDYELYDLLENYFKEKNYPDDIKKSVEELCNIMKTDFDKKAIKSYNNNQKDIIDVKEYEELVFNDGTSAKREIMFDVFMLYSYLNSRKNEFKNLSTKYQAKAYELLKQVEDYENDTTTKPRLDIVEINYYKEVELED